MMQRFFIAIMLLVATISTAAHFVFMAPDGKTVMPRIGITKSAFRLYNQDTSGFQGMFTTPSNYMSNATRVISQLTNFTINCWVFLTFRQEKQNDRQSIFSATSGDGKERMWIGTYGQSGTKSYFGIATQNVEVTHYTSQGVSSNEWSMLTFVLDGTNMYTYINAVASDAGTVPLGNYPVFNTATNPLTISTIGSQMIGSAPIAHWYGLNSPIDGLAVWTNALTPGEIFTLYNGGNPRFDGGLTVAPYNNGSLVALWRFDEHYGSVAADSVGVSTATIIGVTHWIEGVVPSK